ncbi:hypothetical protein TIFTF001_004933 [Ficus carica]|uniref:Uncharacterized protein n=1 Tax=Ficus carica TaxID=3494 RepID=A0AA87ZZX0_FICCA|nr:hypothetical protein TIFTF001_004933 [Ficus carica]
MGEVVEGKLSPKLNNNNNIREEAVSAPPFRLHSPLITWSSPVVDSAPKTPKTPLVSRFMSSTSTPLASPVKKAIASMQSYLDEVGHFTKLEPQEAWLPITESSFMNRTPACAIADTSASPWRLLVSS